MDVPFLSSSAINREHYNLVQGVEAASTLQQIDDILVHKVDDVRRRFEQRAPISSECVASLILLLYCWTATSLGHVTRAALEFALPHAVTLAEAGGTLKEKRTGYLFCTEVMSKSDELQLMLVNTLRKDLEDPNPARICLALDVLLLNCPTEAIPAVTPRLIDLLAHDSPHVKRKAIAAIRVVATQEPEILLNAHAKLPLRLKDPDPYVIGAALRLLGEFTRARIIRPHEAVNMILEDFFSIQERHSQTRSPRLQIVEVIGQLVGELLVNDPAPEITTGIEDVLFRMIEGATDINHALVFECFRTISRFPTQNLRRHFTSNSSKPLSLLGRLISSPKPNIRYFCITCLLEIDATLWSGAAGDIPAAFDENQVHTIMGLLDSPDSIIRTKTLQVLSRVDKEILLMHLTQLISVFSSSASPEENSLAERALEVSAVYEQDGEAYANRLREICVRVSHHDGARGKQKTTDSGVRLVLENIVEQVLLHLRNSSIRFREGFVDATVRIPVSDAGPTLTLVIAAAVCEYGALSTISQKDLLHGLAERLEATPPAIQEALLLVMLRVTARCGSAHTEVSDQVRTLHGISRRHIRRRCEQYLTYSERMSSLNRIVESVKSDTLPDFLFSLETAEMHGSESPLTRDRPPSASSVGSEKTRSPIARGKLRYEAYEPPRAAPKLTHRRGSTTSVDSHSSRSARSDSISSSHSRSHHVRKSDIEPETDGDADDGLSRTLTAGDLALAAHGPHFAQSGLMSTIDSKQAKNTRRIDLRSELMEDLVSKADLIALDSPFLAEPSQPLAAAISQPISLDFELIWGTLKGQSNSRGWCESGAQEIGQRFQAITTYQVTALSPDLQPYPGEIKLVLSSKGSPGLTRETGLLAAVRVRSEEEGSALWQMRCLDATLQAELRKLVDNL